MDAWAGKYLFVYLTPELAVKSIAALQKLHSQRGICLVAVDEAHCVSGVYLVPSMCNTKQHFTYLWSTTQMVAEGGHLCAEDQLL